ncbi:hypothetical protein JTB14_015754 [Gonioctena quinquepunctata]|nr:hypothetical protein JTB14_015754 [Gonioctena quinquepunctata]
MRPHECLQTAPFVTRLQLFHPKSYECEMLQDEGLREVNDNADGKESGEVTVTEGSANGSHPKPPKAKSVKRKIHLPPDIDQKMDEAYKVFENVTDTQISPPDQCSSYGELLSTKLRTLDADTG